MEERLMPIGEVGARLGLLPEELHPYGPGMGKIDLSAIRRDRTRPGAGRLILVSAITPTRSGEGKTTTSIGLAQALVGLGESACVVLREPSLGPCLGRKGGGTGGGRCKIHPSDRINLHFTGDAHGITSAHNLLAAMLDNHIYFANKLRIDPRRVLWRRVLDMNDRALREVVLGLGGRRQGVPREGGFDITAASEVMAILCLAEGPEDLRDRLDRILVAFTYTGEPVRAGRLNASGAMMALLRDALLPNLVQTTEGVPAIVHGGPFANIAHGCNSVMATRMALQRTDWAITEAGFGFDLGAEKFYHIKCRGAGLDTAAVVLVATVRALKLHGGARTRDLLSSDPTAVAAGLPNLEKHVENIGMFSEPPVVCLNRFESDTREEIEVVHRRCEEMGVAFAVSDHYRRGGKGAEDLARKVMVHAEKTSRPFSPLYELTDPVPDKIRTVATRMYGARDVYFTKKAERDLKDIDRLGCSSLPICIAKTHSSLSDDPRLQGRPKDFEITVEEIRINAGAGFLVVITGDIIRMPGLPKRPLAAEIDVVDGEILGLE